MSMPDDTSIELTSFQTENIYRQKILTFIDITYISQLNFPNFFVLFKKCI